MAYNVRVSDEIKQKFAHACKVMGFKQNAVIEGYMKEIISRAETVEALKNIDGFIGVPFPIFHDGKQVDIVVSIDGEKDSKNV